MSNKDLRFLSFALIVKCPFTAILLPGGYFTRGHFYLVNLRTLSYSFDIKNEKMIEKEL